MNANLLVAINEVMKEVGYVQKTGYNDFHKYKYTSEADLIAALRPALVKYGLIVTPNLVELNPPDEHGNTNIIVEYTICHVTGESLPPLRVAGSGNDRDKNGRIGDKGVYKAMTGAMKYFLGKTFMLESGDDPEIPPAPKDRDDKNVAPAGGPARVLVAYEGSDQADFKTLGKMMDAAALDLFDEGQWTKRHVQASEKKFANDGAKTAYARNLFKKVQQNTAYLVGQRDIHGVEAFREIAKGLPDALGMDHAALKAHYESYRVGAELIPSPEPEPKPAVTPAIVRDLAMSRGLTMAQLGAMALDTVALQDQFKARMAVSLEELPADCLGRLHDEIAAKPLP